jgi:hypothetical protein
MHAAVFGMTLSYGSMTMKWTIRDADRIGGTVMGRPITGGVRAKGTYRIQFDFVYDGTRYRRTQQSSGQLARRVFRMLLDLPLVASFAEKAVNTQRHIEAVRVSPQYLAKLRRSRSRSTQRRFNSPHRITHFSVGPEHLHSYASPRSTARSSRKYRSTVPATVAPRVGRKHSNVDLVLDAIVTTWAGLHSHLKRPEDFVGHPGRPASSCGGQCQLPGSVRDHSPDHTR